MSSTNGGENAALLRSGRVIFAMANAALAVETLVMVHDHSHSLGPQYDVLPVLPWLPAIPWLAYLFGVVWIVCSAGLLLEGTRRASSWVLGALLFVCTLVLEVPKNAANIGDISLRTLVFEPLSMACLAFLLPGRDKIPAFLDRASRYLLAISMIIFGVDHFLALGFIANLLPGWIPWHVFWVAFFGVGFIAAGISIALDVLLRWGAGSLGLMFGIWVLTLHLPRVIGLYGIPGAPHNPNEYSSLFIAAALWGGLWALAGYQRSPARN